MIRKRSQIYGEHPEFWSCTEGKSLHVDSVVNAARLVATGEAEAFHICVSGVTAAGVTLPMLGIFVWQDTIELDYRMGADWGPAQVVGFFELLWDCCDCDSKATVVPADCEGPPFPDRFMDAWNYFKAQKQQRTKG